MPCCPRLPPPRTVRRCQKKIPYPIAPRATPTVHVTIAVPRPSAPSNARPPTTTSATAHSTVPTAITGRGSASDGGSAGTSGAAPGGAGPGAGGTTSVTTAG